MPYALQVYSSCFCGPPPCFSGPHLSFFPPPPPPHPHPPISDWTPLYRLQVRISPSGTVTQGTVTLVPTSTTRNNAYSEIHVHSYGSSGPLGPGDQVCFDVDDTCGTLQKLCGPQCGVSMWSGPGGTQIHQCAPGTGLPIPAA
jgi:hypothetical protein